MEGWAESLDSRMRDFRAYAIELQRATPLLTHRNLQDLPILQAAQTDTTSNMTDSITLRVNLNALSRTSRSMLVIGSLKPRHLGQHTEWFRKKVVKEGPISGAGMTLLIIQPDQGPHTLPDALVADLNLPSALAAQNYLHERCGIPSATLHGLKLLKIVLAQMGISADELSKLDIDDVTLDSVTLTYIYPFGDREKAETQMTMLASALRAMLPDKLKEVRTTNRTLYIDASEFKINFYNKTNEKSFSWTDDAPKAAIRLRGQRLIRIEVKLLSSYLRERGLHLPESWRGAVDNDLDKMLFDKTVGKALRLHEQLRQKFPKPEALNKLSPNERHIADHYFEGGDPRKHTIIGDAAGSVGAFSKYRSRILSKLDTDIDIPWRRHQEMRHYELRKLLVCPPPYKVDTEVAEWSYCKENSRAIVSRLDAALEQAIEQYKFNCITRVRDCLCSILDEED